MKKIIAITVLLFVGNSMFSQNKPAPDYLLNQKFPDSVMQFTLQNIASETITFQKLIEKHKGKKVVVDVWASWCKDCLESLPDLQKLQSKTKKKDIDYVFLSLYKTADRWKKAIKKLDIKGDHYFMPTGWKNTLTNYIGLDWIPRYFIIDKEGKVLLPKAVKVSEEFKDKLLK